MLAVALDSNTELNERSQKICGQYFLAQKRSVASGSKGSGPLVAGRHQFWHC